MKGEEAPEPQQPVTKERIIRRCDDILAPLWPNSATQMLRGWMISPHIAWFCSPAGNTFWFHPPVCTSIHCHIVKMLLASLQIQKWDEVMHALLTNCLVFVAGLTDVALIYFPQP